MPKLAVPPSAQPVMLKRVSTQKFQRPEQRNGPVPLRVKLLQGVGALPGQHKEWAFNTLLLIYYSQILGLPAGTAAAVLAVALIVDALTDPLVGALSDSYRSRFGRRHPFMFMSVIPTTLSAFALFAPPPELSYTSLTVWMLLATLGLRVSYTLFVVPWGAVAAELSEDYNERTSIITYRMAVGWIGGVLFIFGAYTYVFPSGPTDENGLMQAANYLLFAWVLSGLMLAYILITSFGTLGQSRYLPQPTAQLPSITLKDMLQRTWAALANRNFQRLFAATLIAALVVGTGQVFDVYMNLYFWRFSTEDIRWFSIVVLGAILSFLTATALQTRYEKRDLFMAALLLLTVLAVSKVAFRFIGLWPDNGDPLLLWLFVAHGCAMAYCASLILIMYASMMADVADEQELANGLRQEGVYSGGITFAAKATTSLGILIGGFLLQTVIAFPVQAEPGTVTEATLVSLAVTDGIIVPLLNLIPLLLLRGYSLDRAAVFAVQARLRQR